MADYKKPKKLGKKNNSILKNEIDLKDANLKEIRHLWEQAVENGNIHVLKHLFTKYFELLSFSMTVSNTNDEKFYGYFLLNVSRKIDLRCSKPVDSHMDYSKLELIFNPILLRKYTNRQIKNFIILEILHMMHLHELRKSEYINTDPTIYHVCCNLTVSHIMKRYFNLPNLITVGVIEEKFGISLEEEKQLSYYIEKLGNNPDIRNYFSRNQQKIADKLSQLSGSSGGGGNSGNQQQSNGSNSDSDNDNSGQQNGNGQQGKSRQDLLNDLDKLVDDVAGASDNWSNNPEKSIKDNMKERMASLIDSTIKSTGTQPAFASELIQKLRQKPIINWQKTLKHMRGSVRVPYKKTMLRRPRRCPDRYDIRGRISDRRVKITVAIDTSGSMGRKELEFVFNEIFNILSTVKFKLTVIECDAEVNYVYEAKNINEINYNVHGRGGTSFTPVFRYLKEKVRYSDYPDLLLYFTDGYGERHIDEKYRPSSTCQVMWVLTGHKKELSVDNPFTTYIKELNLNGTYDDSY